jgi:hypothetical protein
LAASPVDARDFQLPAARTGFMTADMSVDSAKNPREPNHYVLRGYGTQITLSTGGEASLVFVHGGVELTFKGDAIRHSSVEIGDLLTVTVEAVPDLHVVTLTLLIPAINLHHDEASFSTQAIITEHRTSIGGPGLVQGPLHRYETRHLDGVASFVAS